MVGPGVMVSLEFTMDVRHLRRFFKTYKMALAMAVVCAELVTAVYSGIGKESWELVMILALVNSASALCLSVLPDIWKCIREWRQKEIDIEHGAVLTRSVSAPVGCPGVPARPVRPVRPAQEESAAPAGVWTEYRPTVSMYSVTSSTVSEE